MLFNIQPDWFQLDFWNQWPVNWRERAKKATRKLWNECKTFSKDIQLYIFAQWIECMGIFLIWNDSIVWKSKVPPQSSCWRFLDYHTIFLPGCKVQSVLHCFLVKFNLCVSASTLPTHPSFTTSTLPPLLWGRKPALLAVKGAHCGRLPKIHHGGRLGAGKHNRD